MSNTIEITTLEQLEGVVAIVKKGNGPFDQEIKFAKLGRGAEQGKVTLYETTKFKRRSVECNGPILPHVRNNKKVNGDVGPKRPCIQIIGLPETDNLKFFNKIDLTARAAYEFGLVKFGEAFPDLLTFFYRPAKLVPGRADPVPKDVLETMVVKKDGVIIPLVDYLPTTLNKAQTEKIQMLQKRIEEKDCIDEIEPATETSPSKIKSCKKFVFENLFPRIDAKTKRIYLDMNLLHGSFPDGVRQYRSLTNPYNEGMSDIKKWSIVIPVLVATDQGGYAQIRGSDWTKDPSFKAVTKDGERNPFVGTVVFSVDSVMEGSGHVKTWFRASVLKQPEATTLTREGDYDEDMIDAPTGQAVSLVSLPAASSGSSGKKLSGVATVGEEDE